MIGFASSFQFLADRYNATFGYCHEMSSVVCLSSVTRVYCGQTVGRINMKLGMQVGLGPGHIVLDGNPAPPPQKGGGAPKFSAHVYCGQTAAWIRMSRGMQIGLSLHVCDIVLDGDPAPPTQRGTTALPNFFGSCLLWPNGCVISANFGSFRAHCVKVHVRYLIS